MPGTPALLCCDPKARCKGSPILSKSLSGMRKCPSGTRLALILTYNLLLSVRGELYALPEFAACSQYGFCFL